MDKKTDALKKVFDAITQYLSESPDPSEEAVEGLCDAASVARKALAHPEQPAQQQEPLTDEEIDKLPWGPHEGNPMTFAEGLRYFARAIEAAHGIKGEE